MLLIGERINSSRKEIAEAIHRRDEGPIREEAQGQASAGAHYLDVNAGSLGEREEQALRWLIQVVQDTVDLPLCVDSPDPAVIEAVLPLLSRPPMINSITLERDRLTRVLRLAVPAGAKVIALCQDEESMASRPEQKILLAERLVEACEEHGLPRDDLYIDPLVYPLSTDPSSAMATLEAIAEIMDRFPGVHTTCGLSNVSYGLPNRRLVNRTFLVAAVMRGLDSVMLDLKDRELFASLRAALLVAGRDEYCMDYITAYREGSL